ncbi:MAG TPA: EAL domain-containing protein [Sporosarcina psychrophila]|uniref:EAL domain-containing protein n=1 Tax=Sporosarcina psychrophila TaxID=1476 RepID=A0A921KC48_SPOPS|nr:EAL domain-containing protein [Sporosarcina psychrophila]
MFNVCFNLPQANLIKLEGEHSYPIVVLSIIIAIVASFTALSMHNRAQQNSFFHQNFWLALASIAMGFGIWSMHFIGMSAFSLPINMYYDHLLTVISILPAMLASFLAFYIANRSRKVLWHSIIASIVMGLGISTMHYVGMAAMKMDAIHVYDKWLFTASVVIAIFASFFALFILSALQRFMESRFIQLTTAIIMGLAISSMHYTGMKAMSFYVVPGVSNTSTTGHGAEMSFIGLSVTVGMAFLLGLLLLSSVLDRYVKYRTIYYDSLTGLPNHRLFEKRLANYSNQQTLAIWHLHDMEKVNRENGYLFGDEVIQCVSALMTSVKPPMSDLHRIEGNRFAFLSGSSDMAKDFHGAMEKVAQTLRQPLVIQHKEFVLPAVCAWQTISEQKKKSEIYSNVLDVLNYPFTQYKHEIILYDPTIHTYTFEREIVKDIKRAMAEDELYLVFQPKVNGKTLKITGVETLLRWQHPIYGMLSPGLFIPILEESGCMIDVTDWLIERACHQISNWRKDEVSFGQVAINIPGEYVTSLSLLKVLKRTLKDYDLEPQVLELEITETSFVKQIEEAMSAVSNLRQEGFSVALDDFGTGVSSLSYLKQMPISTLKIDKSFIDEVPESAKDSSIIQAIIALGNSLNLSIIFEGIETKEQAQFLTATCEHPIIQGYYFAKPMIASELIDWSRTFQQVGPPINQTV